MRQQINANQPIYLHAYFSWLSDTEFSAVSISWKRQSFFELVDPNTLQYSSGDIVILVVASSSWISLLLVSSSVPPGCNASRFKTAPARNLSIRVFSRWISFINWIPSAPHSSMFLLKNSLLKQVNFLWEQIVIQWHMFTVNSLQPKQTNNNSL